MRLLSRIIKANFQPILTDNGYGEKPINRPVLGFPEISDNQEADSAAAIVDAAAVIRTARIRAAELLRVAEERVVELVTAAEEQTIAIREEARKTGFEAGRNAGYEDGYAAGQAEAKAAVQAEMQKKMAMIAKIAQDCKRIRSCTIAEAERDIVVLGLAVAEKIIRKQIQEDPELAVHIVQDVAMKVQSEDQVIFRVHPTVVDALEEIADKGKNSTGGTQVGWTLIGDSTVEPGGCLMETEFGRIDARLETRFINVSESLLQLLEGGEIE
jgi:flagellar assembly protein FliH